MSYADTLINQYKFEAIKAGFINDDAVVKAWRVNPNSMSFLFTLRMNALHAKATELGL